MSADHSASSFAHPAKNVAQLGVASGMQVADFGAGSGAYTFALAEAVGTEGMVYAIDIQKDLLRRLHNEANHRGYANIRTIWADIEQPHSSKIGDHALDLVLVSNVLFQVADKRAVIAEAKRILKKNGRLAIIDWSDSFNNMGPHKDAVVSQTSARELLVAESYTHISSFAAGAHHWGLIAHSGDHS